MRTQEQAAGHAQGSCIAAKNELMSLPANDKAPDLSGALALADWLEEAGQSGKNLSVAFTIRVSRLPLTSRVLKSTATGAGVPGAAGKWRFVSNS